MEGVRTFAPPRTPASPKTTIADICPRCGLGFRFRAGVGKLRPARVYYAARRHVLVKIFEVLFRVFESQPVNLFHSSRTLSRTMNTEQLHSSH